MRERLRFSLFFCMLVASGCSEESTSGPSATVRIVEAGWSFGFCIGPCRGVLEISGTDLTYRVTSRTGDQIFAVNRGRLTAQGASRLDSLVAGLPEELLERYGCPDCADGGASFLLVARADVPRRSEYEHGNPPPELQPIDSFLQSAMDALGECRDDGAVTIAGACTPLS